jgi:4-amino-4-deoxy-L-arabinose transferase-like glycosyltransferase
VGGAVLGLAMVLPWISIPGGALARALLAGRGDPIPGTGAAWRSLPLLSVFLALLLTMATLVAFLSAARHRLQVLFAGLTAGCGLLVFVALIDKLFAQRVSEEHTAVGAGGYLGLVGVVTIVAGASMVIREARAVPSAPRSARSAARVDIQPLDRGPPELGARSWIWAAVGTAAILAAYLATRLSFESRFPYFFDEALYADFANQAAGSQDKLFTVLEIGQGPLLIWLGAVWVQLGFAPLTAVRLVSVTAGLLTVGVIGLLARSLWGAAAGWVAAGLCVALPFFVVHDGIGIYEPLVTLIIASALFLQIAMARRPDPRVAALLGVVLAAGILTKQNSLPALALLPVSLLCFDWSDAGRRRRLTTWIAGVAIVAGIAFAAYLVQRSSSYYPQREAATKNILLWPVRSVTDVLNDPFGVFGQNWATYRPALIGYVTVPLILTTVAGAVLSWRTRPRLTAVLVAWIVVPFAIGMMFQLRPFPRHAMFLVPAALVLSAYALVEAARFARQKLPRRTAAIACAAGLALLLAPALTLDARVLAHPATARYPGLDYWQYVAGWPAGGPWRSATDLVRRRGAGREVVILIPGSYTVLRQSLSSRYVLADASSPLAPRAQFGLFDTAGFPVDPKGFDRQLARLNFTRIARFQRPRGPCSGPREPSCGGSVVVYERR